MASICPIMLALLVFCMTIHEQDARSPPIKICRKTVKGEEYRGTLSRTTSGYTCQAWKSQSPHRHKYRKMSSHGNYCRNPDQSGRQPWCYTTSRRKRWEYCNVPMCGSSVKPTIPGEITKLRCENTGSVTISCPSGKTIDIRRALYGRQGRNSKSCRYVSRYKTNCASSRSLSVVRKACQGKRSCSVQATNRVFGDPCVGTYKYLEVVYACTDTQGSKDCRTSEKGEEYSGKLSRTKSGLTCQQWRNQSPHRHKYKKLANQGNYCRNPDESGRQPWCYTTSRNKRWEYCDVPKCSGTQGSKDCRTSEKGEEYSGKLSRTKSGLTCQQWRNQSPHRHKYKKLANQGNYCRNPDESGRQPWCYTTSRNKRWEYCDVPKCGTQGSKDCRTSEKGEEYSGKLSRTKSGLTCQQWRNQSPHRHKYKKLANQGNYCRNPDESGRQPWCYTTSRNKRWEYCDVPKCGSGPKKCGENAELVRGKTCRCKRGFFGNPDRKCEGICRCGAQGDPHYTTFDGERIHFQGNCMYLLSRLSDPKCGYMLNVKNEHRRSPSVTLTRMADFKFNGKTYRLLPKKELQVDGMTADPCNYKDKSVTVMCAGRVLVLMVKQCGIALEWDGNHALHVMVPRKYGGPTSRLSGICGGCDGNKENDWITQFGDNVKNHPNKYNEIGMSWQVYDDSDIKDKEVCSDPLILTKPLPQCPANIAKDAVSPSKCGIANPSYNGPFKACLAAAGGKKSYFEDCVFDYCQEKTMTTVCELHNTLIEDCNILGYTIEWRDPKCPARCTGENQKYYSRMSACQPTCMNPNPTDCDIPPTSGCGCKEGFVLGALNKCVRKESGCGCNTDKGYFPLGATVTTSDCRHVKQCKVSYGVAKMVNIKDMPACSQDGFCTNKGGDYKCVCRDGMKGDGRTCRPDCKSGVQYQIVDCSAKKACKVKNAAVVSSVRLQREFSNKKCFKDRTFVLNKRRQMVVVKNGCQAQFKVGYQRKGTGCAIICGTNAYYNKRKSQCMCKRGYVGDPDMSCSKMCRCRASGDPHYETYDGDMIHFMGTCKYTLTRLKDTGNPCYFNIEVKNENRRGNTKVSYTRMVDFTMFKTTVRLMKGLKVQINGRSLSLPQKVANGNIYIFKVGKFIKISTKCGVSAIWDGKSIVGVMVPESFAPNMEGLCGDCNKVKDDFRTKDGKDVSGLPRKQMYSAIGDSYIVNDDSDLPNTCSKISPPYKECTDAEKKKAAGPTLCGLLSMKGASPLKQCLGAMMDKAKEIYDACIIDVCNNLDDEKAAQDVVCQAVTNVLEECDEIQTPVVTKLNTLCGVSPEILAQSCRKDQIFDLQGSSCPVTCLTENDENMDGCFKMPVCRCKDDMMEENGKCVSKCGTVVEGIYLPIGTEVISEDCKEIIEIDQNGDIKRRPANCKPNTCAVVDGKRTCANIDATAPPPIPNVPDEVTKLTCENQGAVSISCSSRKTIDIRSALYGRQGQNSKTCRYNNNYNTNCASTRSLSVVRKACQGKNSCSVQATNSVFGDPCVGTYKYLEVVYACIAKGDCKTTEKGEEYRGTISKTKSGLTCQEWRKRSPHRHKYYKKLADQKNYCRNPDASGSQPWCYTTSRRRWEYCDVPKCTATGDCKTTEKGEEYRGTISKTKSGLTCQEWRKTSPHRHKYSKKLADQKNYCRNPDASGRQPWCYTTSKRRWEYCDVPKCTGGEKKCGENAVLIKNTCRCKRGYFGNPNIKCEGMCRCSAKGDPHYQTFDGVKLHFQGNCKYILSQLVGTKCAYTLSVKNEHRKSPSVTLTRMADFKFNGKNYRLLPKKRLEVDGISTDPCNYVSKDKSVAAMCSGRMLTLVAKQCGIVVAWDGNHALQIIVPSKYGGPPDESRLSGICGSCDGNPENDWVDQFGQNVKNHPNKYNLIGISWQIPDDSDIKDKEVCSDSQILVKPLPPCPQAIRKDAISPSKCGIVSPSYNGPFKACLAALEEPSFFGDCVFDYCQERNMETVCEMHDALIESCNLLGHTIEWRDPKCPKKCTGENEQYFTTMPGCPATCVNPNPTDCDLPLTSGCGCKKGFVLGALNKCVRKDTGCGCNTEKGYFPLGATFTTNDCRQVMQCKNTGGRITLVSIKNMAPCSKDGFCTNKDGDYKCVCRDGMKGDGRKCTHDCKTGLQYQVVDCTTKRACGVKNAAMVKSVQLQREFSRGKCFKDRTFVLNKQRKMVVVKNGCQGQFKVGFYAKGKGCAVVCGTNAYFHKKRSQCMCKRGYVGDPDVLCSKMCTCRASGDPHYQLYDGQAIHFMGTCKYTLTRLTDTGNPCYFNVEVKNENRRGNTKVSYTRLVDFSMYKVTVRLMQGLKVQVNGKSVTLPQKLSNGNIYIFKVGKYIKIRTKCGVSAMWDGKSMVGVMVPDSFAPDMEGICGDCNKIRDDFKTKDGKDVSDLPKKQMYNEIGDSYRVTDDSDLPNACQKVTPKYPECTDKQRKQAESNELCGVLSMKNKSPFRNCLQSLGAKAQEIFEGCVIDVCNNLDDPEEAKKVACLALSTAVEECTEIEQPVTTEKMKFCGEFPGPESCRSDQVYDLQGSSCPVTCLTDDDENMDGCFKMPVCRCKDDMTEENGKCVSKCGVVIDEIYYPTETETMTEDCEEIIKVDKDANVERIPIRCEPNTCKVKDGKQVCVVIVNPCASNPCDNGGSCSNNGNNFICKCRDGWKGRICEVKEKPCEKRPCKNGGSCRDNGDSFTCSCNTGWKGRTCEVKVKPCDARPCKNGGSCKNNGNSFTCSCRTGWKGRTCEKRPCDDKPCKNGGSCENRGNSYVCTCRTGWKGPTCEVKVQPCDAKPCKNGGSCTNNGNSFTCTCRTGWKGRTCEKRPCDDRPCKNGGSCENRGNSYVCSCRTGWKGPTCEVKVLPCDARPCQNGGSCKNNGNSFTCSCRTGWKGRTCEKRPCDDRPCKNGGSCKNSGNSYVCSCRTDWKGPTCEVKVQPCDAKPCQNGGSCRNNGNSFTCSCRTGWQGRTCEKRPCDDRPCKNGGSCENRGNSYVCSCRTGWKGPTCEVKVLPCDARPCKNGGSCRNNGNSFTCSCRTGWKGSTCEKRPCDDKPCKNGGSCKNSGNSYVCSCRTGWKGPTCEVKVLPCDAKPCQNGGSCKNNGNSFTCSCRTGWKGRTCEKRPCDDRPCKNGGSCENRGNSYACSCRTGWKGPTCEVKVKPCDARPCKNGGSCTNNGNSFRCSCRTGWIGRTCEEKPCYSDPCQNGGSCQNSGNSFKCNCRSGWKGALCDVKVKPCDYKPCNNGGSCRNVGDTFSCKCINGWTGKTCAVKEKPCDAKPCKNGGSCTNIFDSFSCKCANGWKGSRCEVAVLPCDSKPCKNGGTCTNEGNTYSCECTHDWEGPTCEEEYSECDPKCVTGQECISSIWGWAPYCECKEQYSEAIDTSLGTCLLMCDYCSNGKCMNDADQPYCKCNDGYKDKGNGACEKI